MTELASPRLEELRSKVSGVVAQPGESGYAEAVAIWNGSIERRPSIVVRAGDAADVAAALLFARAKGLEVSVRGGGHGFSGFALTEGGLMIDLTLMKSVEVDPTAQRAFAGGGVTWGEFDTATQAHGLAVTGGMISHTGVAGLTLGGGIGWLTPVAGLSCDNLVGAELVTADGHVHQVSETAEPELLWALKGGGGNFGVVTKFEYALHRIGPIVHFGMFYWGLDQGREALRFMREFIPTLPTGIAAFIASTNAPEAPFVPQPLRSKPGWVLALVGFGDAAAHANAIAPVRDAVPALFELVEEIPYAELQRMFDSTAPWGALSYEKAVHLDDLSDAVIDVMVKHQPRKHAPLSFTPILILNGVFANVPDAATAFSGSRGARYVINITAVCATREQFDADRTWVRDYWSDLVAHAPNAGSYVNFMSEYDEDRVRAAYGAAKYERLAGIKRRFDPDNFFHLNANIKPRNGS
jgi:FAD/FMN-containing dehydrogenase